MYKIVANFIKVVHTPFFVLDFYGDLRTYNYVKWEPKFPDARASALIMTLLKRKHLCMYNF